MKNILISSFFLFLFLFGNNPDVRGQNIGINTTGTPADASSMLDVSSTNKGLLIPRVALASATTTVTIASPATSLMVYNDGTGGLTPAGYYYNSGTPGSPIWTQLITPSTLSTTGCADACGWALVAVGNSVIGSTGSVSTGYTLSSAKEVMVVIVYDGSSFTYSTSDTPAIFEVSSWSTGGTMQEVELICSPGCPYTALSTGVTPQIAVTKIKGRKYNASTTKARFTPYMSSSSIYGEIDGTGLIYLADFSGLNDAGMYIFER